MAESKNVSTICSENLDQLTKKAGEPGWLEKLRLDSWHAYNEKAAPGVRSDEWRKTLVETLELSAISPLTPADRNNAGQCARKLKSALAKSFPQVAGSLFVVDGTIASVEIDKTLSDRGLIFSGLREALAKHEQLVKEYLTLSFVPWHSQAVESKREALESKREGQADNKPPHTFSLGPGKLALMAGAFFTDGVFLYVPRNVVIEKPFLIVNQFKAQMPDHALFPRVIVVADECSSISVINVLISDEIEPPPDGRQRNAPGANGKNALGRSGKSKRDWFLSSSLVDVYAKSSSNVKYLELQRLSAGTFSAVRNHNRVDRDAYLYSLSVGLGGGQIKSDINTILTARGASADVFGVALGDSEEHLAFNTIQNHDAPDTKSNINFRVALKGRSVSSYQGNIIVALNAARTDAYQSNKNLLLSREAKAESIPRLEILTDDVKCSHGATVGPVDKNQVFYLMSRGLDEREAEELIVSGFFNTVLSTCSTEGARDWIEGLVSDKIQESGSRAHAESSKTEVRAK